MDELTIGDKIYISSKRAASITGYAKDYIGQLCREGRVEATLVGRSWYVLETSIRAHRFGSDQAETASKPKDGVEDDAFPTWESPKYMPEHTPAVPTLEKSSINLLNVTSGAPAEAREEASEEVIGATAEDMQTAWREWFAARQETNHTVADEVVIEPEASDEPDSRPGYFEEPVSEEVASVSITKVEKAEESAPAAVEYDPVPFTREIEEEVAIQRTYEPDLATAPRMRIVGERPRPQDQNPTSVKRSAERRVGKTNLATKSALIAVAILAVLIGLIGSGLTDAYVRESGFESSLIRFFAGTSIIEK